MKRFGFTLTELIIAMAIIGSIVAMTVPAVINNYQKNANVLQLRKTINDITDAVDIITTEESKTKFAHTSVFTQENGLDNFILSKFNVNVDCNAAGNSAKCFANEGNSNPQLRTYISIDGSMERAFNCSGKSYLLANGVAICAKITNGEFVGRKSILYNIDINGPDKPNVGGRDMFSVYQLDDKIVKTNGIQGLARCTELYETEDEIKTCELKNDEVRTRDDCKKSPFGFSCYGNIVDANWKMDY